MSNLGGFFTAQKTTHAWEPPLPSPSPPLGPDRWRILCFDDKNSLWLKETIKLADDDKMGVSWTKYGMTRHVTRLRFALTRRQLGHEQLRRAMAWYPRRATAGPGTGMQPRLGNTPHPLPTLATATTLRSPSQLQRVQPTPLAIVLEGSSPP